METNNKFFPKGFLPGPNDVLMGRGKKCYQHIGNVKFRDIVALKLDEYSLAKTKQDKSTILATVMAEIRNKSCNGGFLKNDPVTGLWFQVGEGLAREKTSQAFRDALEDHYRSSNSSKKKRRRMINAESRQRKNDTNMYSQEQMKSVDVSANEFDAFNYHDSSKDTSGDQIYHNASFPSDSYKNEMECFEPLPFSFDQMSSMSDELDFNNFEKDIDLDMKEDCADLMSAFSSLCFKDDIDYEFEQEFSDDGQMEPTPILEISVENTFSNNYGMKPKHRNEKGESNYNYGGGFTQTPSCRTRVAKSA